MLSRSLGGCRCGSWLSRTRSAWLVRWRAVRVRTTLAASVVVGLALLLGAAALLTVLRRSLEDNVASAARLRAEDVAGLLESGASPEDLSVEEDADGGEDTSLVQVIAASGAVRVSSSNVAGEPAVVALAHITALRDGGSRRVRGLSISPEDPYLVVAAATDRIGGKTLTVLVARALEPADETVASMARVLVVGLPLLLALVALTTWTVVGRALRPVEGDSAVLRVDDDGPGVPPADRDRVFERFTRLDDARTRGVGGSGLGLAIVAQLVERHGGTVRCLEAPGGGARLEVRLPAIDTI